jgi:hypothetical protein
MSFTRAFRQWIARGLIGLMLFTQLAIASYACPGLSPTGIPATPMHNLTMSSVDADHGQPAVQGQDKSSALPSCDQMAGPSDKASPNLCAEHCHYGQQSAQVHAPAAPAVALVSLYIVAPTVMEAAQPISATSEAVDTVAMAPSPPHAILHCCIRD